MNSKQSKTKEDTAVKAPYISRQEADIKIPTFTVDGLKIVSVQNTTIIPNGHIIAFYKGRKVLIPVRI